MNVVADVNGKRREAYKVGGKAYKVFPSGTNLTADSREFENIEEVAVFLTQNPSWGVRMNPGAAIIYENIRII